MQPRILWRHLLEIYKDFPPEILERPAFTVALYVVKHFLGVEWIDKHVSPFMKDKSFFRLNISEEEAEGVAMSAFRIIDLGELLFNLQRVPGFDECVARMRAGDLEATLAELDFARMLWVNLWNFRFVVPQGVKGLDYDYDIDMDGLAVCADAKCKVEGTALSEATIYNTLEKARKQLPSDRPGIICIKIPQRWMSEPDFEKPMLRATKEFFGQTERIVAVSYYGATLHVRDGSMGQGHHRMEVCNPNNRFSKIRDWRLLQRWIPDPNMPNALPIWWTRLLFFPTPFKWRV